MVTVFKEAADAADLRNAMRYRSLVFDVSVVLIHQIISTHCNNLFISLPVFKAKVVTTKQRNGSTKCSGCFA